MADTIDTRPGVVPANLKTGPDGELPELPRRAWVWCRGPAGDRSDFRSDRLAAARRRGYTPVPDYPVNFGPSARPGKARAGGPAPAELAGTVSDGRPAPTTAETDPERPASTLGAVEPADERQPDTDPTAEPAGDGDGQAAEQATDTKKARRTR